MTTFAESEVIRLETDIARFQSLIADKQSRLNAGGLTTLQTKTLQSNIATLESSLAAAQSQLAQARTAAAQAAVPTPQPQPPATAAQTVQDDAPATPATPAPQTAPPVVQPVAVADTNTDPPVKTVEQTQAITAASNSGQAVAAPPTAVTAATAAPAVADRPVSPVIKAGAAAGNDDAANTSTNTKQSAVDATDVSQILITPRPNVLDQFSSYTYSASIYLLTPTQYTALLNSKNKKIDGYQLLFQSGGAANNVGGIRTPAATTSSGPLSGEAWGENATNQPDGGRNPFFDDDFYIDTITIETLPPGKGAGAVHNVSSLKFTVIEPNGITLLDRLYDAVANSSPKDGAGKVNYTAATYLMVIRFYGYDETGHLMQVRSKPDQEGTSDPGSVVEKFIPFSIKSINWSVESKLVSYEWDCAPIGQLVAGFAARGTIPYDVQLVDSTVGGLLGGNVKYSSVTPAAGNPGAPTTPANTPYQSAAETARLNRSGNREAVAPTNTQYQSAAETARLNRQAGNAAPPQKADAAPTDKKTITKGLVGAMNDFQQKLVRDGIYTLADEYEIRFEGADAEKIANAKLQLPNTKVAKRMTAAGKSTTQDAQNLDPGKQYVDMVSRSFSITAGQQMLQAIELTIRNSSYIHDQSLVIIDPDGTIQPNPNNTGSKPFKWFTIMMTAEPISSAIDPKRNDYAYRIIYTVRSYTPKNVISKYFPISPFTGVNKSYPYWFSGENIAVIEYKETLNALYQLTVSGSDTEKSNAAKTRENIVSGMADLVKYFYAPRSTETSQGAAGKENELSANLTESLLSPGDVAECKLRIVGDPDWIMQGSLFRLPTSEIIPGESVKSGFLPDGSVSFDTQDILFEITWQRPRDYDIAYGLANPREQSSQKYNNYTKPQSRVYVCKRVVSEFKQGKFEQTLEGALYYFPTKDKSNVANPAASKTAGSTAGTTDDGSFDRAEMAKLKRQGIGTGGGQSSAVFAATDPRRLDRAAVLGAQPNTMPDPRLSLKTTGIPTGSISTTTIRSSMIQNAPPPAIPTSDGVAVSAVPATVTPSDNRLPTAATDQDRDRIQQQIAAARARRAQLQESSGARSSAINPSNQQISREE